MYLNINFIELHISGHEDVETMEKLNQIVSLKCTTIVHIQNNDEKN